MTFSTLRNKMRPNSGLPKMRLAGSFSSTIESMETNGGFLGRGHVATVDLRKRSTCAFERHLRLKTRLLKMYHLVMTNIAMENPNHK